jgi:hypothetical protein
MLAPAFATDFPLQFAQIRNSARESLTSAIRRELDRENSEIFFCMGALAKHDTEGGIEELMITHRAGHSTTYAQLGLVDRCSAPSPAMTSQ